MIFLKSLCQQWSSMMVNFICQTSRKMKEQPWKSLSNIWCPNTRIYEYKKGKKVGSRTPGHRKDVKQARKPTGRPKRETSGKKEVAGGASSKGRLTEWESQLKPQLRVSSDPQWLLATQKPPQGNTSVEQSSGGSRLQWLVSYSSSDIPHERVIGQEPSLSGANWAQNPKQLLTLSRSYECWNQADEFKLTRGWGAQFEQPGSRVQANKRHKMNYRTSAGWTGLVWA